MIGKGIKMKINNRIKELRNYLKINTEDFAARGGVSLRAQQMYESGKTMPTAEYCAAIAASFPNISLDWLLTGNGEMLKTDTAANELNLSRDELNFVEMLRGMSEYQKNDTLKTAENFIKSNREIIERYSRGDLRMAA